MKSTNKYLKFHNMISSPNFNHKNWQAINEIIEEKFLNKRVINLNEEKDGYFDILQIIPNKAAKHTTNKKSNWQLIVARKQKSKSPLTIITCSSLFFDSLKILSKAKYKITTK